MTGAANDQRHHGRPDCCGNRAGCGVQRRRRPGRGAELNPWACSPGIRTGNGSTSTTGDARAPSARPWRDGDIAFEMLVSTGDPSYIGIDQYGG